MELSRRSTVSWVKPVMTGKIMKQRQLPGTTMIAAHVQALEYISTHVEFRAESDCPWLHTCHQVCAMCPIGREASALFIMINLWVHCMQMRELISISWLRRENRNPITFVIVRTLACDLPAAARCAIETRSRPSSIAREPCPTWKLVAVTSYLPLLLPRTLRIIETYRFIHHKMSHAKSSSIRRHRGYGINKHALFST